MALVQSMECAAISIEHDWSYEAFGEHDSDPDCSDDLDKQQSCEWSLQPVDDFSSGGERIQVLVQPQITELSHDVLHPACLAGLRPLDSIDDFADLLGVPDWKKHYACVLKHEAKILSILSDFKHLPARTRSIDIESVFGGLVKRIAFILGKRLQEHCEEAMRVGGILHQSNIDMVGQVGFAFNYWGDKQQYVISCVAACGEDHWTSSDAWYEKGRGCQALSTLFIYKESVCFLVSQKRFKVLLERDRSVWTFPPCHQDVSGAPVSRDLIKLITIALLAPVSDNARCHKMQPRVGMLLHSGASEAVVQAQKGWNAVTTSIVTFNNVEFSVRTALLSDDVFDKLVGYEDSEGPYSDVDLESDGFDKDSDTSTSSLSS